jgi:hypothetical protein
MVVYTPITPRSRSTPLATTPYEALDSKIDTLTRQMELMMRQFNHMATSSRSGNGSLGSHEDDESLTVPPIPRVTPLPLPVLSPPRASSSRSTSSRGFVQCIPHCRSPTTQIQFCHSGQVSLGNSYIRGRSIPRCDMEWIPGEINLGIPWNQSVTY